jgi:hypothetical protein
LDLTEADTSASEFFTRADRRQDRKSHRPFAILAMSQLLPQIIQILDDAGISKPSRAEFMSRLQLFMTSKSSASQSPLPLSDRLVWAKVFALFGQYFEQAESQPHDEATAIPSDAELISFPMTESEWDFIQRMREMKKHHNSDSDSDCVIVLVSDAP